MGSFLHLVDRTRPILLLAAGLVLISVSFSLSEHFKTNQSNLFSFQKAISEDSRNLKLVSDELASTLLKSRTEIDNLINFVKTTHAKADVLVYSSDSLIAWTENRAQIQLKSLNPAFQSVFANDGVYLVHSNKQGEYNIVTYKKVWSTYTISNSFLSETCPKSYEGFGIDKLTKSPTLFNIQSTEGKFLFGVRFANNQNLLDIKAFIGFFVFIVGLIFFLYAVIAISRLHVHFKGAIYDWGLVVFIFGVRAMFFIEFPAFLGNYPIFSPFYYASSWFSASLGDAFLNATTLVVLSYFILFQSSYNEQLFGVKAKNYDRLLSYYWALCWLLLLFFARDLVINSSFEFVFTNPFEISTEVIIGLICIIVLLSGLLAILNRSFQLYDLARIKLIVKDQSIILPASFIVNYLVTSSFSVLIFVPALISFGFYAIKRIQVFTSSTVFVAVSLTIMGLLFSVFLVKLVHEKEHTKRRMLLYAIESRNNDPLAASNFLLQRDSLIRDKKFLEMAKVLDDSTENEIVAYIRDNYFQGFWSQFSSNITICKPNDQLYIKPEGLESNCYEYFDQITGIQIDTTNSIAFKSINSNQCLNGYFGKILLNENTEQEFGIFIEFVTRLLSNDFSLPELFIDQSVVGELNLGNYSLARYSNANLLAKTGEFDFAQILNPIFVSHETEHFSTLNGYNHLIIKTGNKETLILSKQANYYTEVFSIFTFVVLFLVLAFLMASLIYRLITVSSFSKPTFYLSTRIQIFIIIFIFGSFAAIGFFSISFYRDFYERKNLDFIKDKVHSIQIEVLSKIVHTGALNLANHSQFETYLAKFASIFFTDIHIYKPNGLLYATSRPELFDMGLISSRLNPTAYQSIIGNREAIYVTRETIGSLSYYSAYIPIVDNHNAVSGIINVPFFARHAEFQRDVSKYLATFVNVFLFLSILAVLLAIVITNYFVKPLHTLSRYFSELTIGRKNITIPIFRKDELGQLIELYNEMVVQLDDAVQQLKERERESAWKEVAKQVAHEIKNPLTPIKLGLQFLIRAKQTNDPDWNERFKSFSDTLLVQIESMTQMANSFSEFTRLPEAVFKQVEIEELIAPSVMVLNEFKGSFEIENTAKRSSIYCDKMQIIRVLVNLLKNAEQAVRTSELPKIQMVVSVKDSKLLFAIYDNGVGIAEENLNQIFKPNFTTKSSGMGLGLFMSKAIVENHNGKLWFDTKVGEGTAFYVLLPLKHTAMDKD